MRNYFTLFVAVWFLYAPTVCLGLPPNVFFRRASDSGPAPGTFVISEDAEGAGLPSGWVNGANPPNWDYTATVLTGTESIFFPTTGTQAYAIIPDSDYYVAVVQLKVPATLPNLTRSIISFNLDANYILQARITATGGLRIRTPIAEPSETVDKFSPNTTYYIKFIWTDGGVCSAEFSTTTTFLGSGNKYKSVTGQSGVTINRFNIGASSNSITDYVMDTIRVAPTNFTL